MYLSHLRVAGFRGIGCLDLEFQKGINVLIGENTTCKTAVLDALRLCLSFASERRDIYVQPEDFFIPEYGEPARTIQFDLTFSDVSSSQQGMFLEMLDIADMAPPVLRLHVRFDRDGDRIRRSLWGGAHEGQDVPYPELQLLYSVYLGALRDAVRDLAPSRSNRLSQLFLKLVAGEGRRRQEYAEEINAQTRSAPKWNELLKTAAGKIESHLREMALSGDASDVDIEFVDATFKEIAESLRLSVPRSSAPAPSSPSGACSPQRASEAAGVAQLPAQAPSRRFAIAQTSLGFSNLLYIATVFGDLLERAASEPSSYSALLIEEPEAHLHPQWQSTLFGYLRAVEKRGAQVFITSHSPTITAKSDPDWLIVMSRRGGEVAATPVRRVGLTEEWKRYLQRFLDVTKSQLFFARSVILVEGICEALLLPSLASSLGPDYELDKHGVEVVNVDGVAFAPFAALFNAESGARLGVRCSVITDDDREGDSPSPRAARALALRGGQLDVFLARYTFEYELYLLNEAAMLDVYAIMHPQTDLEFPGGIDQRAKAFVDKLRLNKDKAILAQSLASRAPSPTTSPLLVPEYINRAIAWAVGRR